jgi:hypothetical protein
MSSSDSDGTSNGDPDPIRPSIEQVFVHRKRPPERSPSTLTAMRWERERRRSKATIAVVTTLALAFAAAGCAGTTDDGAVTAGDEQAVTADWRQALIATPRQPDEDAFCATLAAELALPSDDDHASAVFVRAGSSTEELDRLRSAIVRITGTRPELVDEAAVRTEILEMIPNLPPDLQALPTVGARFELPEPITAAQEDAIEAEPNVEFAVVRQAPTSDRPTVLDTLATMWPSRLAGSDLILWVRPGLGDEPLADLDAELRSEHGEALASVEVITQADALVEFRELFADDPTASSITADQLPASLRLIGTSEAGLQSIGNRFREDLRISEVTRIGAGFQVLERVSWFLGDDLPGQGRPALEALAATAPDELAPDVAALIQAFPTPDRLAVAERITGPGDDVAIARATWDQARPSVERIFADAEARCGLTATGT